MENFFSRDMFADVMSVHNRNIWVYRVRNDWEVEGLNLARENVQGLKLINENVFAKTSVNGETS